MAKRFIDSNLFRKPLVRGLEAPYKLLFIYLICDCDHAGIWEVELDIASLRLDRPYKEDETLKALGDVVQPFDDGQKWFLPDFVEFQYGRFLNEHNKAHKSVIALLQKHGLDKHERIKPLLTDKPETPKRERKPTEYPAEFEQFWELYPNKTGKKKAFSSWKAQKKAKDLPAIDILMGAIRRQMESEQWRKEGGRFIPHPGTWLNQGRWEDGGTSTDGADASGEKKAKPPAQWKSIRDRYFEDSENKLLDQVVEKKARTTQDWHELPKTLQRKMLIWWNEQQH
jgi:hypothetical protein